MVAATVVQRWGSVEGVVARSRSSTSPARSFHFSRHAAVALLGAAATVVLVTRLAAAGQHEKQPEEWDQKGPPARQGPPGHGEEAWSSP